MERLHFFGISLFISCILAITLAASPLDKYCSKINNGVTYFPGDCNRYINCSKGVATVESCGWFKKFDEDSMTCKLHVYMIGYVNCSLATGTPPVVPTTPSPNSPTTATTKPSGASTAEINTFIVTTLAVILSLMFFK